jgi:hypothetical protein
MGAHGGRFFFPMVAIFFTCVGLHPRQGCTHPLADPAPKLVAPQVVSNIQYSQARLLFARDSTLMARPLTRGSSQSVAKRIPSRRRFSFLALLLTCLALPSADRHCFQICDGPACPHLPRRRTRASSGRRSPRGVPRWWRRSLCSRGRRQANMQVIPLRALARRARASADLPTFAA